MFRILYNPHSLVAELSSQLDLFNSLLGVRPDHGKMVKSVLAKDEQSGQMLEFSIKESAFKDPHVISQKSTANGVIEMRFPDHKAIELWLKKQEENGDGVVMQGKGVMHTYFLDTLHLDGSLVGYTGLEQLPMWHKHFLHKPFQK
ncbi:MAG: hypothetical protein QX198_13455 [Methylococcaceae bacterium]